MSYIVSTSYVSLVLSADSAPAPHVSVYDDMPPIGSVAIGNLNVQATDPSDLRRMAAAYTAAAEMLEAERAKTGEGLAAKLESLRGAA